MTQTRRTASAFGWALLLCACADPLKQAQLLEEPRILGVRVSDPDGRATLSPGMSANLELLVAGPQGPVEASFAYRLCEAADSARGVPYCADSAFAEGEVSLDGTPIALSIPDNLPRNRPVALLGVACAQGNPKLSRDPLLWSCSDSGIPLRVSFTTSTASADNKNPDMTDASVELDGTVAAFDELSAAPSCDTGTLEVMRKKRVALRFVLAKTAREGATNEHPAETLQLSHFTTRGELERQFSFVDPSAKSLKSTLQWRAPNKAGPVKHYLVVRDDRGGVSWSSFSVCVR